MRFWLAVATVLIATAGVAAPDDVFESIDGGQIALDDYAGQPVLVVNTASMCGFSGQYEGLQDLYDSYRAAGLVVLAVPSDDFQQELDGNAEVRAYCEMVFGIDLPMTVITPVLGTEAHPFYARIRAETGFEPRWNFNKVLLDGEGAVIATYSAMVRPNPRQIIRDIEAALPDS